MMDDLLQYIISTAKKLDSGELPNYPDPAEPEDLGDPLTQDEIDTLKKFIKEIKLRYATCGDEKTGISITDTQYDNFTISWTNPAGSTGAVVRYRLTGSTDWLTPTGSFNVDNTAFTITAGLTADAPYDILVKNICSNTIESAGVIVQGTATDEA